MSEIKVNSIKGVGASAAAITVNNTDGTCTANITNNLSNRNLIINGAMQVAQRGTSSTANGFATIDRFSIHYDSGLTEAPTQAQVALSSSDTPYASGFRYAFKVTNGNQTSIDANDYINISQKIEAQNIAQSGWNYTSSSSKITLSFWVKASIAQTMYVRIEAPNASKIYAFAVAVTTSWQKITHSIVGDSSLAFNNDNGSGLAIRLIPYYGTSYTASGVTVGAWISDNGSAQLPDMANTWFSGNDATLEYTGVQLEVGSNSTDFEHRSFAQELELCSRYYRRYTNTQNNNTYFSQGNVDNNGNDCQMMIFFDRPFRTQISSLDTSGDAGDYAVRRDTTKTLDAVPVMYSATDYSCFLKFQSNSHGWSTGQAVLGIFKNTDAFLGFSAEL